MKTRQQTIDTLKAEILLQATAAGATDYVYWTMEPAAQQQIEETGDCTVTTDAGTYSMSDVINHAARAARELQQEHAARSNVTVKPRDYSTERYSRLMKWARRRYNYINAAGERCLDTYHGYEPTRHTIVEAMAASAYLHIGRTPRQVLADGISQAFSNDGGYRLAQAWRKEQ